MQKNKLPNQLVQNELAAKKRDVTLSRSLARKPHPPFRLMDGAHLRRRSPGSQEARCALHSAPGEKPAQPSLPGEPSGARPLGAGGPRPVLTPSGTLGSPHGEHR